MKTYPLINKEKGNYPFAFEIDNIYIGLKAIAHLLSEIDGVTNIHSRKLFRGSSEIHVEFKYLGHDYIVWEPYGDNSRYWIGPKVPGNGDANMSNIEDAFKHYRPPLHRKIIGDILMLRFLRILIGRKKH